MHAFTKEYEAKMTKRVDALTKEYQSIRAGRANPSILDRVTVLYYDVPTPINQLAAVSVTEARTLMISPWDKTTLKAIEKAIQASDVGINPQNDGSCLRLVFPPLTEERRKDLCKNISKMGEEAKIAVRNVRRDANDKLKAMKKASEISEDEVKDLEKEVQDLTDKFCKNIDTISHDKEEEIMSI